MIPLSWRHSYISTGLTISPMQYLVQKEQWYRMNGWLKQPALHQISSLFSSERKSDVWGCLAHWLGSHHATCLPPFCFIDPSQHGDLGVEHLIGLPPCAGCELATKSLWTGSTLWVWLKKRPCSEIHQIVMKGASHVLVRFYIQLFPINFHINNVKLEL